MAQFILFSLALFAIACVFYGISAGVQAIRLGFYQLAGIGHKSKANLPGAQVQQQTPPSDQQPATSSAQRCLDGLKELHGLHQTGALSQEEFEQLKQYLLSTITYPKQEAP